MTAPVTTLVEVRDLVVRYGGRVVAGVPELDVAAGECVAIVGESGSGKTTTLMAVLGLIGSANGAQITGNIVVCDIDMLHASRKRLGEVRGARIALVMQSPQAALSPTMRLGTLMRRALARHGVRGDAARTRAADAVAAVLLDGEILRRYPHEVSGGQAQRFAIALAIALGAEIIVADEPTSALDVTVQAEVVAVLRRLRDERGLALLLVSHDLALVSTIADRVLIMRDGRVVESGPAATVFATPANPYTRELIAAIPVLPDPEIPAPAPSDPKPSGPEPSVPEPSGPEPSGPELSDPEPSGPEPSGPELSDSEPSGPDRSVSGLSDSVWSDLERSGPVCPGPVRPEEAS